MRRSAKYRALKILKKMDIFVKNLPFEITEQEINEAFARYGEVSGVKMLFDKVSGRFRGMAFVTMQNFSEAQAAIDSLNGADLGGRPMRVEVSRPRELRITGFGGGFSREKRSFSFKRRNFDRGAADGGDAGNTQEPEGEGRYLSPAKNSAGARMKNADSAAEKSLLIEKKAALKNALTTVILKDKTAVRAITAESPTLKNKNLPRFFVSKRI